MSWLDRLAEIEELEIHWPSGHQQTVEQLPINQSLRITEGIAA